MIELIRDQLWPYIKPFKGRAFLTVLLSFCLAGIGAAQVSLVRPIFDRGFDPNATEQEIFTLAAMLLGLGLLNFPCRFFHFYWIRKICDRATLKVREELFQKIMKLPQSYFTEAKQGQMISTVINDTQVFSQGFKSCIDLIREPAKAIAYLGMAFYADWLLTLVIFFIAPFLVVIFQVSGKKVKKNQGEVQHQHGELTQNISEGLASQKITKAFNLQNFVKSRFDKAQEAYYSSQLRTSFVEEFAHPLVEMVGAIAFSGVIIFSYYRIQDGQLTVGEFISFVAALALFMDPIRKFSQANVKLSQARAASERVFGFLKETEERDDGTRETHQFNKQIEIRNLSFSYGERNVLEDFSANIGKGEKVAFVGLSGSGKSTLINLLLGLYSVERGMILIDGKDINDLSLHSLREIFGLVSQDIFLFNDSIEENLKLGEIKTEQELSHALEVAYAKQFVAELPKVSQTIIGDRGMRLSGGQQQRITIARAFLRDPQVYLFDEATSALDNESEKIVQRAMDQVGKDKTVVAIAHRLSTVQDFDKIYVLNQGRLVESGAHPELLQQGGEYAKLYQLSQA